MKFIVATKQGMTQLYREDGVVEPVTVLEVPKVAVTQVKTKETDGYAAVQVGYGEQKESRMNKAQRSKGLFKGFKEFRTDNVSGFTVGQAVAPETFAQGDVVTVTATSKGKGFQGVVKRHGFGGGRRTHGQKHSEREPGSIGGGPGRAGGRVAKGMRMAGRMGSDTVTVKNLTIVGVDAESARLFVRGAVPGRKGTVVSVFSR
jgi:large subunit ribosomal protein L3